MNFAISRTELIAITGIKRTRTFELQKTGQLGALSPQSTHSWFDLTEVLKCAAMLHGLPPPDELCVERHARLVVEVRLKGQLKRS